MMSPSTDEQRNALLRIGAVCAIAGTLGYLAFFLAHGDLPDETAESALAWVAEKPLSMLHMGIILCSLLWVGGLVALASSLVDGTSWALGQLGSASAVIGATLLAVHYRIDGPALEEVAAAWAAAAGAERERLLERGDLVLLMTGGGFPLYVALFLGLPFLLFGVAMVFSSNYPSWLGWLGTVAGAVAFVVGTTHFVGLGFPPIQLFVLSVFLLDVWMFTVGVLMWRRAGSGVRELGDRPRR
ncbi:MAG: hypothetical protein GEV09_07635 [Pseudonocardiaceae bacterium]|nr:hypothetical protein [Pseudonocardiaceae bacterium]